MGEFNERNTLDELLALDALESGNESEEVEETERGRATEANMIVGLLPPISDPVRAANGRVAHVMGDHTADLYDLLPDYSVAGPDRLVGVGPALVPVSTWQGIRFLLNDKEPDTSSTVDLLAGIIVLIRRLKLENLKMTPNNLAFEVLAGLNLEPQERHRNSAANILPRVLLKWGITLPKVLEIITSI